MDEIYKQLLKLLKSILSTTPSAPADFDIGFVLGDEKFVLTKVTLDEDGYGKAMSAIEDWNSQGLLRSFVEVVYAKYKVHEKFLSLLLTQSTPKKEE